MSIEVLVRDSSFVKWAKNKANREGWGVTRLSQQAHLSSPAVSQVFNGKRNPGHRFCDGIATAFGLEPEVVYRRAGLLPKRSEQDLRKSQLIYLYSRLGDDDQEAILAQIEAFVSIRGLENGEAR